MMKDYRCNNLVFLSTEIPEISRNDCSTAFSTDSRDKNVAVIVGTLVPKGVTAAESKVEVLVSLVDAEAEIGVDVVEGRMGVTRKEELAAVADPMEGKPLSSAPGLDEISIHRFILTT